MDGRTITVPLAWFTRLANATPAQRSHWQLAGAGYGIHWPDVDEDLSTEGCCPASRRPAAQKNGALHRPIEPDWRVRTKVAR
jgi:Protein of unknown function (DUF2442)